MAPKRLEDISLAEVQTLLSAGRLALQTGPLVFRIKSTMPDVARSVQMLYGRHPFYVDPEFADFHVELRAPKNLRRWLRRQAEFLIDGESPFEPLPRDQAPAMLEWGMNWAIASSCHQWLTIHAASLERNGQVVILPAPPGSGKSTLCAALALRGWRLLSDELTLIELDSLQAHALARSINLKNQSIDVIQGFEPAAVWSPETYDTTKGRVTHLVPPVSSVDRMLETAQPRWIVFPRYVAAAEPLLTPRSKVQTFTHFAENAFNYSILGELGFETVDRLIRQCDCYDFEYSRLDDALEVFDWLAEPEND
ncbi:HprK-related kinase A [Paucibacter sp. B2R-40]|uniref:HprK-related kinase A n=1 Tax=Paucibacter sp. B2R-40 TaxID=2893554 RepID=UPI0021E4B689|nr:HprK-related kinase A [Paucibacter sp. B2R-40]MCV2353139.1 HprK-related kinase A [Paucibacter sp. B2R-40]